MLMSALCCECVICLSGIILHKHKACISLNGLPHCT